MSIFSSTFFAVIAIGLLDAMFLVTLDTCETIKKNNCKAVSFSSRYIVHSLDSLWSHDICSPPKGYEQTTLHTLQYDNRE